jgi:hypothetical protein
MTGKGGTAAKGLRDARSFRRERKGRKKEAYEGMKNRKDNTEGRVRRKASKVGSKDGRIRRKDGWEGKNKVGKEKKKGRG